MHTAWRVTAIIMGVLLLIQPIHAQKKDPPPAVISASAGSKDDIAVAAWVNKEAILEPAVERGLKRVPPDKRDQARVEILDYLIDNLLIDQHLKQQGENVAKKDVDDKIKEIHGELEKHHESFEEFTKELMLSESELRANIEAELRWNQFAAKQATDANLRQLFKNEPAMFDGTVMRARHILRVPDSKDPKSAERERAYLLKLKKWIEGQVAKELAKLPTTADNLTREKTRIETLEKAFGDCAREKSDCKATKADGGDVQWFGRAGTLVEPFAKAAFALKPYEMADVVETPFGLHLILATDRRQGREVTFDDVKAEVKEVYCAQLRDNLLSQIRSKATVRLVKSTKTPAKEEK